MPNYRRLLVPGGTFFFTCNLLDRAQSLLTDKMNYIHQNPVKHALVTNPDAWPYSTWHEWKRAYGKAEMA